MELSTLSKTKVWICLCTFSILISTVWIYSNSASSQLISSTTRPALLHPSVCSTIERYPEENGLVAYRCTRTCSSFGTGLSDRLKGVLFAFLVSLVTRKNFSLSLDLSCSSALDGILDSNCVDYRPHKRRTYNNRSWQYKTIIVPEKNVQVLTRDLLRGNILFIAGRKPFQNLELQGNSVHLLHVLNNSRYSARVRRLLPEVNHTYQSVAEALLRRLFKVSDEFESQLQHCFKEIRGRDGHMCIMPAATSPRSVLAERLNVLSVREEYDPGEPTALICAHLRLTERGQKERPLCNEYCLHRIFKFMFEKSYRFSKSAFVLASDEVTIMNKFKDICPKCNVIEYPGLHGHTGMMTDADTVCRRDRKAVGDLVLLSRCDVLVVSRGSFFGKMAHYMRSNRSQETCFISTDPGDKPCVKDAQYMSECCYMNNSKNWL